MEERIRLENGAMPQTGMPNSQAADPAAGAQPLYTAKAAQPFKATRLQLGAALYSYLLGWFYFCGLVLGGPVLPFAEWYVGSMNPVALGVFCALFFGGAEFFLRQAGRKAPAESWWWLGFSALLLANLLIVRPLLYGAGYWNDYEYGYYGWQVLALHLAAMYWLVCRAGLLTGGGRTGCFAPLDAALCLLGRPFCWFFLRIQVMWYAFKKLWARVRAARQNKKRDLVGACLALCLLIPLFLLALMLLAGADAGFASLLERFAKMLTVPEWVAGRLLMFVGSLPVGAYLYGALGSVLRQKPDPERQSRWLAALDKQRCLPQSAMTLGLLAFCGLYLLFFVVQAGYLFGAFFDRLPAGFTAAEYARRGFFELCAVAMLNFGLLLAVNVLCKGNPQQRPLLRGLTAALMASNLLFVLVGASKMGLYVTRFGLTEKRILSSWFMLVLAVVSVLALLAVFRGLDWIRLGTFAAAGLFLALCLCQPQALAYRVNLALYQNGTIHQLDPWTLHQQGAGLSEYELADDLLRAGWGMDEAPEDVRYAISGYSERDELHYARDEQGNRQVWFRVSGKSSEDIGTLTMTLDESGETVTALELTSNEMK